MLTPTATAGGTNSKNGTPSAGVRRRNTNASNTPAALFGSASPFSASSPLAGVASTASHPMASQLSAGANANAKSPARSILGGIGSIPSPAAFATMAAGVQESLLEDPSLVTVGPSNDLAAAVSAQAMDPLSALTFDVERFASIQMKQTQETFEQFFDLYESAIESSVDSDAVLASHAALLASIDQLLVTSSQAGFAGLSTTMADLVDESSAGRSVRKVDDTEMKEVGSEAQLPGESGETLKPASIVDLLTKQSRDTFERRERLRESASMITNILTQSS